MTRPIPDDIINDHTCKSYVHFPSNCSPLDQAYCHWEREPHKDDGYGLYYGEWVDKTETDRETYRVEQKKKEIAAIARQAARMGLTEKDYEEDE